MKNGTGIDIYFRLIDLDFKVWFEQYVLKGDAFSLWKSVVVQVQNVMTKKQVQ